MEKLNKFFGGLFFFLLFFFIAIFGAWYFTFIDKEVTKGSVFSFTIGDSKKEVFEKLIKKKIDEEVSGSVFDEYEVFKNRFPNELKSGFFKGKRIKDNVKVYYLDLPQINFSEKDFEILSAFDNWGFSWGEVLRNSIDFSFRNEKLSKIRRVRTLFSK